jgi:hypothetical protein
VTEDLLPSFALTEPEDDPARDDVVAAFRAADPDGRRAAAVLRATFDQLYDGQRTGRYSWNQLYKTEKTHYGTLLEINLRRTFDDVIDDTADDHPLDYLIRGHDVDCKYSQNLGGWMLPPECFDQLLIVATANDQRGTWSLGVVRASENNRRPGKNRDAKASLSARGRKQIDWVHFEAALPPNILLSLDQQTLQQVLAPKSGQARVTELLRQVTQRRIGRNTIATLAQQDDYMARLRDNGNGARTTLRAEGYLIPGGDYEAHRNVARQLGVTPPEPGEVISLRVTPAAENEVWTVELEGRRWRLAHSDETTSEPAPKLPDVRKAKQLPPMSEPTNLL